MTTAAYYIVPDFLPRAEKLRECIERHFAHPDRHGPEHQVWNYWHVPETYTYLRTNPEKIIDTELLDEFLLQLTEHAVDKLGMDSVGRPYLSLYVDGCGQTLHNDSRNGALGYVYSLTRWDERKFSGGETLIFRETDYWSGGRFRSEGAATSFYDLVPSRFNQLLLFDDRLLHGVPTVRGVMDPLAGRLVLHGHITAGSITVRGALKDRGGEVGGLRELVHESRAIAAEYRGRLHGFATYLLSVAPSGRVTQSTNLVERVFPLDGAPDKPEALRRIAAALSAGKLEASQGDSRFTIPIFFE